MKQLPLEFQERMKTLLGDEYENFIKSYDEKPVRAFRVNTDKISLEDFEKLNIFSTEKIPYVPNGFYFDYDGIGNHPYHHAGMFYIQEPAAMVPVESIEIQPEWKVLDLCAAPGGKSSQIKNKLGENGVLVSNEIVPSRCKILTGNMERMGFKNVVTTCMHPQKLVKMFPENYFNMIVVDAPCSGEGMFRKEEVAVDEWSLENVKMCAERQKEILDCAAKLVKLGGYIVYSTCTYSLEENEMMVDAFLQNHPDFELVPVTERVRENTADGIKFDGCKCENIHYTRRCYSHRTKGEGQFVAVLHYADSDIDTEHFSVPFGKEKLDKTLVDFLDDILVTYKKDNVQMYNGNPVYFTPDFPVPRGVAFACGVTIGEIRKNYIVPHHQFFMAMGKDFKRKINLTADCDEIKKYLHGEEFDTNCQNGWAVVMVDGCTVGGVKVSNGRAKNHYPKGLRR
ncbi:MAG: RNA methyltransferase [Clostridia bacterium]|nr:RNA methyltransferase [Clostridia bacterium]